MNIVPAYPKELLDQHISQRLSYFEKKVIGHPILKQTHDNVIQLVHHPGGASVISVIGPTGVGKTTLRHRIEKLLYEESLEAMKEDPSFVPVIGLEAIAPENGNFNWKEYYIRALLALEEPCVDQKLAYGRQVVRFSATGKMYIDKASTIADLRSVLEQALSHRRPHAFIVDEAQHFKKVTSGRRFVDQMDNIKSLAGMTNTIHVLIGTYELLSLMNLNGQLSRRCVQIHFPRYTTHPQDIERFKNILFTFQNHLPLPEAPDLINHYEYIYERSVGCIGVLKSWLNRALAAALEEGSRTLGQAHLERHAKPIRELLRMANEIHEGEEHLSLDDSKQDELRSILSLNKRRFVLYKSERYPHTAGARRQPGERSAIRDKTGNN